MLVVSWAVRTTMNLTLQMHPDTRAHTPQSIDIFRLARTYTTKLTHARTARPAKIFNTTFLAAQTPLLIKQDLCIETPNRVFCRLLCWYQIWWPAQISVEAVQRRGRASVHRPHPTTITFACWGINSGFSTRITAFIYWTLFNLASTVHDTIYGIERYICHLTRYCISAFLVLCLFCFGLIQSTVYLM